MGKAVEMTPAEREEAHARNEQYSEQILEMLVRGDTFRQIEAATGVPRNTVHKMARKLMSGYVRDYYGDHASALGRELHILDQLTRKNLGPATRGDESAARIVLASHTRRCKLLGLEAAAKLEVQVKTAQDIEIERLVAQMTAQGVSSVEDTPEGPDGAETVSAAYRAAGRGGSE